VRATLGSFSAHVWSNAEGRRAGRSCAHLDEPVVVIDTARDVRNTLRAGSATQCVNRGVKGGRPWCGLPTSSSPSGADIPVAGKGGDPRWPCCCRCWMPRRAADALRHHARQRDSIVWPRGSRQNPVVQDSEMQVQVQVRYVRLRSRRLRRPLDGGGPDLCGPQPASLDDDGWPLGDLAPQRSRVGVDER
jgi:hypothetical protein